MDNGGLSGILFFISPTFEGYSQPHYHRRNRISVVTARRLKGIHNFLYLGV